MALANLWESVRSGGRRSPPGPPEPPADNPDDEYRFHRLRESYQEVLAATKHEDDKVGRFLAAIAFLVAGALISAQQAEVLQVTYDLGAELALPALSLVAFLFVITLAVLQYVLAIAAPVTIPPGSRDVGHSHLFFHVISVETGQSWAAQWALDRQSLRRRLMGDYQREILNLAQRAHTKRARSEEASALFAVALLFFGLTVGFSIDALANGHSVEWSFGVRSAVASWLAAFTALMLYQRYRGRAVRRIGLENGLQLQGFGRMSLGLVVAIAMLLLPGHLDGATARGGVAAVLTGAVLMAIRGLFKALDGKLKPGERAVWLLVGALFSVAAVGAVWFGVLAVQLLLAIIAGLSPLAGQLTTAFGENARLRKERRKRAEELRDASQVGATVAM